MIKIKNNERGRTIIKKKVFQIRERKKDKSMLFL